MFVTRIGKLKENRERERESKKMEGEEKRKGKMDAVILQSMRRREVVEKRGRDWEKPSWEVKSVQARVDKGCGK